MVGWEKILPSIILIILIIVQMVAILFLHRWSRKHQATQTDFLKDLVLSWNRAAEVLSGLIEPLSRERKPRTERITGPDSADNPENPDNGDQLSDRKKELYRRAQSGGKQ